MKHHLAILDQMKVTRALPLLALLAFPLAACADLAEPSATPLRFAEFFKRPVGPRGLEPTPTLMSLAGSTITIQGFVARTGDGPQSPAILAPVPVLLGDEDESLADDLPPSSVHLHLDQPAMRTALQQCGGLLAVQGVLDIGPQHEADDRISFVRIHVRSARCLGAAGH